MYYPFFLFRNSNELFICRIPYSTLNKTLQSSVSINQKNSKFSSCPNILIVHSAQLAHPWAQMCTLLDRSSVIFKFPSLRFNFYQGLHPLTPLTPLHSPGGNLSHQIFSFVFFFLLRWHLRRPSVRIFLSLKLGGSPNPRCQLATRLS